MMRPAAIPLVPILIAFAAIAAFLVVVNFAITPPGEKTVLGWRTYTHRDLGFAFQYPPTLRAVHQESSDLLSVRFEPLVQTGPIMAGVDELTVAVMAQSLDGYRAVDGGMNYQPIPVAGKTGYRSPVRQGIEGNFQTVLIGLGNTMVIVNASGKRIELLDNIIASFRYLNTNATNNTNISNTNESTNGNTNTTNAGCRATGCSGQVCSDQDVITTCEYRVGYACYQTATCEQQANGECGWTSTTELTTCLNNAQADVNTNQAIDVACAQDVRSCPDGSTVSRQPPDCAFASCPDGSQPSALPITE